MSTSLISHLAHDYSFLSSLFNKTLCASALAECQKFGAYHGIFNKQQLENLKMELIGAIKKMDRYEQYIAASKAKLAECLLHQPQPRAILVIEKDIATAVGLLEALNDTYTQSYRQFMYLVFAHNEKSYMKRVYAALKRSIQIHYLIHHPINKKQ